jgi:hypothetical protein
MSEATRRERVVVPNDKTTSPYEGWIVSRRFNLYREDETVETYVDASVTIISNGIYRDAQCFRIKTWGHNGDADGDTWRAPLGDMVATDTMMLQPGWNSFHGFVEIENDDQRDRRDSGIFRYEEWALFWNPERAQELRDQEGIIKALDAWGYDG